MQLFILWFIGFLTGFLLADPLMLNFLRRSKHIPTNNDDINELLKKATKNHDD